MERIVGEAVEVAREFDYAMFGVRAQDELPADGSKARPSRVWVDGVVTNEELPGTSALPLSSKSDLSDYPGEFIVLLGADYDSPGEDDGERVLGDAVVLAAWKRTGERVY